MSSFMDKAKDLAASDTIARGKYQEAAEGSHESPVLAKMVRDPSAEVRSALAFTLSTFPEAQAAAPKPELA